MRNKKQSAHRKFTISPRLRYGAMSTAIVALVIAALILINLAATNLETRYGWRGDFSFNAVTTQSETTKQILHDLKRPVKIYALFERETRVEGRLATIDLVGNTAVIVKD